MINKVVHVEVHCPATGMLIGSFTTDNSLKELNTNPVVLVKNIFPLMSLGARIVYDNCAVTYSGYPCIFYHSNK